MLTVTSGTPGDIPGTLQITARLAEVLNILLQTRHRLCYRDDLITAKWRVWEIPCQKCGNLAFLWNIFSEVGFLQQRKALPAPCLTPLMQRFDNTY